MTGRAHDRRILVVDDNEDAASTMADALRLLGNEVVVAHNGAAALAIAKTFRPDVAILDLGLPGMDGYELARRLREDSASGLRLIAATGFGQERDRHRSHEAGFAAHLVKPIELSTLVDALGELAATC